MEQNIKDLLVYNQDRYIMGRNKKTDVKMFMCDDGKGRDKYIVTVQYWKDDPAEEVYSGLDEEEAVKIFTEYD
jgi:hypothetical protein